MLKNEGDILQTIIAEADWANSIVTKEPSDKPSDSKSSFKYFIAKNAFKDDDQSGYEPDAIYFNDIAPIIYIKRLKEYNPNEVIRLHNRFWNEGRTPLSLIITPQVIKILDNFTQPLNEGENIDKIQLESDFSTSEEDLKRLVDILHQSKIDSETVIGETLKVRTEQRVDRTLIEQLRAARKILYNDYGLDFSTIHDLLGRSLFTLYLEHRDILTKEDIHWETGKEVDFFELLKSHPKETYKLFDFLKDKFNGDLFPITKKEKNAVEDNAQILRVIYDCYTGEKDLSKGQLSLFRLFNFKYIPIELISAIYEEFMSEEDVEKKKIIDNKNISKKSLGAYYTPQMLVEFVYNEILPMPSKDDHNYNIKILDPACGSGIFLVEGFKRLIERWKFTHETEKISQEVLHRILKENIYGIEIDTEAIKITAFSLYLTFLQYMNPRDILRKVKFEPLIYWTKNEEDKESNERSPDKYRLNLLRADTFIRETEAYKSSPIQAVETFFNTEFDLIVGNPPWKSGNVDNAIKKWANITKWNVSRDIIKAYLAYSTTMSSKATIALISSSKILFNTSGTEEDFRNRFFKENKVSVIVNFSVVRNVLFEKAKQAAALIIYQHRVEESIDLSENVIYVVPKTKTTIKNRKTITIDASEIKHLPLNEIIKPNSKIFKIAMYGGLRDLRFINRLNQMKSIDELLSKKEKGIGLKKKGKKEKSDNKHLENYPLIPKSEMRNYYVPYMKHFEKLEEKHKIYRINTHNIFDPPLILINEGTKDSTVSIAYIDYKCVYPNSIYGISFANKNEEYHKALTTCLNSTLAKYYYFLISSNWGVSKGGQLLNVEALSFPAILEYFTEDSIKRLAFFYDEIRDVITGNTNYTDIVKIQNKIDEIIKNQLNISEEEETLIQNVLNYNVALQKNYKASNAEHPTNINKDLIPYAQTYLQVINKHFEESEIRLKSEVYEKINQKDNLAIIKFYFDKDSREGTINISDLDLSNILNKINEYSFNKYKASIYYRRFIKYKLKKKNTFYLIKPNEKRFWTKAVALNDADELIIEILNQGFS